VEDLIVSLAMDNQGSRAFATGADIITDDANRFAVASLYESGRNISAENLGYLLAPYDPLLHADSFIYRELVQQLAFDYVARRIHALVKFDESARARIKELANRVQNSDLQVYMRSLSLNDDRHSSEAQRVQADDAKLYPNNSLLRDTLLESRLAALSFGESPDAIPLAGQSSSDHVVLRAAQFAARNDWSSVAGLDSALAQIPWTSLWNSQAVRLRVEWRVRMHDAASSPRFDADSIEMIDRLMIFEPNPRLYLLRAMSAGNEPHVMMESLFRFTLAMLQGQVTANDITRGEFDNLQKRFEQLHFDDPVDQHHYREVQSTVTAAAAMFK
jgi:hypothetical protein